MGLAVVTPPTAEPVSLAEARAHCRVDSDEDDGLLSGYLMAARQHCEAVTRRVLATQTLDYTHNFGWPADQNGWPVIWLPVAPVQSVTSISYLDLSGTQQTLAMSDYVSDLNEDAPQIREAYGTTWPDVQCTLGAVVVRFVAGYTTLPEPIRQAILLLTGHWYGQREAAGKDSQSIPFGVQALLSPFMLSRII